MKPMNFPGRKNRRRIEAVQRLYKKSTLKESVGVIIDNTNAKIVDQGGAENLQTKINREKR